MSAGITTRIIGDLIVVHGDDKGLVMPFPIAPTQVAILTIFANKDKNVSAKANELFNKLNSVYSVALDESDDSFGYKIAHQETQGTPFSIIIGPKDLEQNKCMLIRRDNGVKQSISLDEIEKVISEQAVEYQNTLYANAKKHLDDSIVEVSTMDEFKKAIADSKIALAP
jgi:prolyl-tRNA synthetase